MPPPTSLSERFHEATKYTPERLAQSPGLDLSAQPSPFKDWYQGQPRALPGGPRGPWPASPGPLNLERLGRLLFHTYGVTRVSLAPGQTFYMRASPSAGGLYPSELYVAVRGIDGLPDGIHDYLAREHALALCWEGDFLGELARNAFDAPAFPRARAVLIATGVWQRSAWRYGDRAYRRVLLDTGHMLANAMLAAPADGLSVAPAADFLDDAVDGLLLLDGRRESTLLLGAVGEGPAPAPVPAARRSGVAGGAASPEPGAWIPVLHDAGRLTSGEPPRPLPAFDLPATVGEALVLASLPIPGGAALRDAIRRRRSTRAFRRAPVPLEDLGRILAAASPRTAAAAGTPFPADDLLTTWLVVSAVSGLTPGVYRYDPQQHALALVRAGDPRRALFACCLQQELGRDAACAVIHTFHLPASVARYGERAYRYAHLTAGMLGEHLALGAVRLGHGTSGIGGFLDEDVGDLLLLPDAHAVAYITVLGVPA